jgi:integrase
MRKTFATVCYLSGVDDVLTKRMMGHAVSDITHSTYIKNDDILLLRDAMSKVDYACLK